MAEIGVAAAAKLVGRDRKTLYRLIKEGKLSATKDHQGATVIETSELIRYFGPLRQSDSGGDKSRDSDIPQRETPKTTDATALRLELERYRAAYGILKAKADATTQQLADTRQERDALRADKEAMQRTLDRALLLLEHKQDSKPAEPAPAKRPGFWRRLFVRN